MSNSKTWKLNGMAPLLLAKTPEKGRKKGKMKNKEYHEQFIRRTGLSSPSQLKERLYTSIWGVSPHWDKNAEKVCSFCFENSHGENLAQSIASKIDCMILGKLKKTEKIPALSLSFDGKNIEFCVRFNGNEVVDLWETITE